MSTMICKHASRQAGKSLTEHAKRKARDGFSGSAWIRKERRCMGRWGFVHQKWKVCRESTHAVVHAKLMSIRWASRLAFLRLPVCGPTTASPRRVLASRVNASPSCLSQTHRVSPNCCFPSPLNPQRITALPPNLATVEYGDLNIHSPSLSWV